MAGLDGEHHLGGGCRGIVTQGHGHRTGVTGQSFDLAPLIDAARRAHQRNREQSVESAGSCGG